MNTIEKIARGMWAVRQANAAKEGIDLEDWTDGSVQIACGVWDEAIAAVKAIREPSPKMLKAACAAMSPGKRPTEKRVGVKAKHGIRFRAMIDAILTEVEGERK